MKLAFIFVLTLGAWLAHAGAESPALQETEPQQLVLRPGLNAVAITRFPTPDTETLTLGEFFGVREAADRFRDVVIWIWEERQWRRFAYTEVPGAADGRQWMDVDTGNVNVSGYRWPYQNGILMELQRAEPLAITLPGVERSEPHDFVAQAGENHFNRVTDRRLALADLGLEAHFHRVPLEQIFPRNPDGSPAEGPPLEQLEVDWFFHPVTEARYVLAENGIWYAVESRRRVDARVVMVPGTFGIHALKAFAFQIGDEETSASPPVGPQEVVLGPGRNAIPITRFPNIRGVPNEILTLPEVFSQATKLFTEGVMVWVHVENQWRRFAYAGDSPRPQTSEWFDADTGRGADDFRWAYTSGVLIELGKAAPGGAFVIEGVPRTEPARFDVRAGVNVFNRVFDDALTLAEMPLKAVFHRLPKEEITRRVEAPRPDQPTAFVDLKTDAFGNPVTGARYVLSEEGDWYALDTRTIVRPETIRVPGAFEIIAVEDFAFELLPETKEDEQPQEPEEPAPVVFAKLQPPPFLALAEDGVRGLLGSDIGPPECTCAFLVHDDDRPISLHVQETTTGRAVVRVGKHPPNVTTDGVVIVSGQGIIAPFASAGPLVAELSVRSFRSDESIPEALAYRARLPDPELREQESRFFSTINAARQLVVNLGTATWQADTLLELDLIVATEDNRKRALHFPQVRLQEDLDPQAFANALARMLRVALLERGLASPNGLQVITAPRPDRAVDLVIDFGSPVRMGKVDLCAMRPVPSPEIVATSGTVMEGGLITIEGGNFGRRLDDLCIVLASEDGSGMTIPVRPLSLSEDGNTLIGRVVGRIPTAQPLRAMIARGIGATRPVALGFPDVIQAQGIWVWRGRGIPAASAPNILQPALGQGAQVFMAAEMKDGSLELKLDEAWPDNATVSISFTASTELVQLDSYAPELCFTLNGSAEDCAQRIQRVLKAAFVQGGMASANEIQVQNTLDGEISTLTISIFTDSGVFSPITSGHLHVKATEGEPKAPPAPEDADGDLVQDSWEMNAFGMPPENVQASADPDTDALANNIEFAFATAPLFTNHTLPVAITLDDEDHPLITYERHLAAPNFYHFAIESSIDGDAWEALSNVETLQIQPIGDESEMVVSRSFLHVSALPNAFYRVRLTPRSP